MNINKSLPIDREAFYLNIEYYALNIENSSLPAIIKVIAEKLSWLNRRLKKNVQCSTYNVQFSSGIPMNIEHCTLNIENSLWPAIIKVIAEKVELVE